MSNISTLFPNSPIKSRQEGYIDTNSVSTTGATGSRDFRYVDVVISAVNMAKARVTFQGSFAATLAYSAYYQAGSGLTGVGIARLTSSTNLRVSNPDGNTAFGAIRGTWVVEEAN